MSIHTKESIHKYYAEKVPNMFLAPENGFFWRLNSVGKKESEWNQLVAVDDIYIWKEQVKYIMSQYAQKTDGSWIEEKESSIIWSYKNANYTFGKMQAKELGNYLESVFGHLPIAVYHVPYKV